MSCLPLEECSKQLTTGAYENAQLSRGKNLHEGAASSLCATHDPHMPARAHGMSVCVMWGHMCEWRETTCVRITLCNTCSCVSGCLWVLSQSVLFFYSVCVCAIFVNLFQCFHWAFSSECDKRRLRKLNNLFDVPFLTLWGVSTYILFIRSLTTGMWGNMELKPILFYMMAFVK